MKKYVKPMMESEAFVANEYIGACYFVSCGCGTSDPIQSDNKANAASLYVGAPVAALGTSGSDFLFDGFIGTSEGCSNTSNDEHTAPGWYEYANGWIRFLNFILGWNIPLYTSDVNGAHHHLTVTEINKNNYPSHPNHS